MSGNSLNEHMNYQKLQDTLLIEYFDKMSNKKSLLAQLRGFLKSSDISPDVKRSISEFVINKLDISLLNISPKDFCTVICESSVICQEPKLLKKLFENDNKDRKLTAVCEMVKVMERSEVCQKYALGMKSMQGE